MPCDGVTVVSLQFNEMVEAMLSDKALMVKERIRALIEREFDINLGRIGIRGNQIVVNDFGNPKIQERITQFLNDLSGYYHQDLALKFFDNKFKTTKPIKDQNNNLVFFVSFPIRAKVKIGVTGKVDIITQEGNFEEGKKAIETLISDMNQNGFNVNLGSPYEQHRHDIQVNQQTLIR